MSMVLHDVPCLACLQHGYATGPAFRCSEHCDQILPGMFLGQQLGEWQCHEWDIGRCHLESQRADTWKLSRQRGGCLVRMQRQTKVLSQHVIFLNGLARMLKKPKLFCNSKARSKVPNCSYDQIVPVKECDFNTSWILLAVAFFAGISDSHLARVQGEQNKVEQKIDNLKDRASGKCQSGSPSLWSVIYNLGGSRLSMKRRWETCRQCDHSELVCTWMRCRYVHGLDGLVTLSRTSGKGESHGHSRLTVFLAFFKKLRDQMRLGLARWCKACKPNAGLR